MKKAIKRTLSVAVILIVLGVLAWLIGMSVIGWDFEKLDNIEYTAKSYAPTQNIEKINVDLDTFPITIRSGDEVSLEYFEATGSTVTVSDSNGVLDIKEDYKYNPFKTGMFNFSKHKHSYVLTVTDGVEFGFNGVSSRIVFEGIRFETLTIKSTNTNLTFVNCVVDALDINSTNTTAKFDGCTLGNVTIDSTNLSMNIIRTTGDELSVDSTNLDFDADKSSFGTVTLKATNNNLNANALTATSLYIRGTNIDCDLKPIKQVDTLYIDGTNIDADILIEGKQAEYNYVMRGKNLPANCSGSTDKTITIDGTNNDVKLKFVEVSEKSNV